ncbi:mechanosensitive ion channel family protein [Tessaracoccus sp. Y36]|uniref:mechanosensitive ion channel family protein n=1 Tax=Tessaracoccus sp. MC1756 TaxID=2760311 RepID=UPI001C71CE1E|nr:mechanosensitive ion channel domain-containing protein [Tessaracoccus sp. MC1756]
MTPDTLDLLTVLLWAGLGLLAGFIVSLILTALLRLIVKRRTRKFVIRRMRLPQRIFFILLGAGLAVAFVTRPRVLQAAPEWRPIFLQVFLILMIFAAAFLLTGVIRAIGETLLSREDDAEETPHFRRIRTQLQIVMRVGLAVIWICALAGALLTFPQFRAIGASLMASAGVLSIVAGLAAQSSLANIFAGMQIAFSDALRVGDLVVFDEQMGSVEEITLTYVVVRAWDDRRWIVPSTYFTSKPFENWTRREPKLLGTVEFDLDWLAPVEAMRVELTRIVRSSELWDGRTASMQVTDATGGHVRIRAVVSAATSGQLWDLRCLVREDLIAWVQHEAVYALPRTRLEPDTTTAPPVEEREDFVDRVVTEWEAEQALEETSVMPAATGSLEDTEEDPALPKWLHSWLSHRRKPADVRSKEESPLETTLSSRSPEARLYSGSPDAEERDRKMSGPSAADMAEREQTAERRDTPS